MSQLNPAKREKKCICFICGIIYEDENEKRVGIFSVPKNKFPIWQNIIPKLKHTSRLCDKHFDETDIVKGYQIGQDYIAAERWKLTHSALPKHSLVRDKARALRCSRTPLKQLFDVNPQQTRKDAKAGDASVLKTAGTKCPGPQKFSQVDGQVATSSGVKRGQKKSLKRLMALDTESSNYSSSKKNKTNCAQSNESSTMESTTVESNGNGMEGITIPFEKPGPSSDSNEHPCGSCDSQENSQGSNVQVPIPFDFTCAGEWIDTIGEFGTSTFRSKWNLPEGVVFPVSTPMQLPPEPIVTLGNAVPATLRDHTCSSADSSLHVDVSPEPERDVVTTASPGLETPPATNSTTIDNIPGDGTEDDATENPAASRSVPLKKPRKKRRFIPPVNCLKCSKVIKGRCSSCLIKELKLVIKEQGKENRELKREISAHVKSIVRRDSKLQRLKDRIKQYRKKLNTSAHRITLMSRYAQEIATTLADLKEDIVKLTANQLEERIKHLTHGEKTIIKTFIQKGKYELAAKSGTAHGMRYDGGFVMQCLLLKLKSSSTYAHIRNNNILPLPSASTIRRRLSSSDCKFGFNELALDNIKKALANLPFADRWVSLMWDEISLKKDLTWHSTKLEWHGIVDFGDDIEAAVKDGIATHALVLMVRPYKGNWVQPIACFASQNAASAHILHEVIAKAIVLLHNNNAVVKNLVCDGCTSNKAAMSLFKICGKVSRKTVEDNNSYFIPHPLNSKIKIYWLFDTPHLLKCTRNHILKHKVVQYAGGTARYVYYERLYNLEKKNHLRRTFKLTESHIHPSVWEKMNVKKAAQLMSDTVVQALRRYRGHRAHGYLFKGSETTEKLTKLINDVFDILNGRFIAQGISISNWGKKKDKLDAFLRILDITEECNRTRKRNDPDIPVKMFLSDTTLQAWRITVLSVISLTEEKFNAGYITVLTGKLNQDPLERFFGIVRGIDDTPTAHSWLQIFRILSLYNQSKMQVIRGNIDNEENLRVLASYEDCLVNKFKACEKEAAQVRESFKEQLLEELSVRYVKVMEDLKSSDEIKDEIIYDMSGYLLKTRDSVWVECDDCKKGLITSYEDLPNNFLSAEYTATRNFGKLIFVTVNFFKIIQLVENVVSKFFDNSDHIYVNNCYEKVMSELCELKVINPCCNKHEDSLPYLMMQYVHIRFHTESKRFRNIHLSKDRTQMIQNKKLSRTTNSESNKPKK